MNIKLGGIILKILVIIDISSIWYSVCYTCNKEDNPRKDDFTYYIKTLNLYVQTILDDTKATHFIAFGDGYTSFRKKLFSEFKGDRTKKLPRFIRDLKTYGTDKWGVIYNNMLEADDLALIHRNELKDKFDKVIIAAIDSDLKQEEGIFYDYGYRRKNLLLEDAFKTITREESRRNLWKQVIIKGHNNKLDYLEGCGKVCAVKYLDKYSIHQLRLATLNAFILGIDKKLHNVPKNIKGFGLMNGIDKFSKAFKQSYLLRSVREATEYDVKFNLSEPIEVPKNEFINIDNNLFL